MGERGLREGIDGWGVVRRDEIGTIMLLNNDSRANKNT